MRFGSLALVVCFDRNTNLFFEKKDKLFCRRDLRLIKFVVLKTIRESPVSPEYFCSVLNF